MFDPAVLARPVYDMHTSPRGSSFPCPMALIRASASGCWKQNG